MPLRLLVRMPLLPLDQLQLVLVLLLGWLLRHTVEKARIDPNCSYSRR